MENRSTTQCDIHRGKINRDGLKLPVSGAR